MKNNNFDMALLLIYVLSIGLSMVIENWVASIAWTCALLTHLRVIKIINID